MISMKFTIELDIGLSFLLQAALPQLVTDRDTKPIVVGGSKRLCPADAARRNGHERNLAGEASVLLVAVILGSCSLPAGPLVTGGEGP
jgi:hypothetical protein